MNILMDKLAKTTVTCFPPRDPNWRITQLSIQPVTVRGKAVYKPIQRSLYSTITGSHIEEYITVKHNINPDTVHWESFSTARSKVSSATNIFITKWLSNTAPTGKILKLRQHCISSKCPRCNTLGEDREHVLTCWGLGATSIWEKGIQELQHLLDQEATHPDISQYMIESLRQYRISPSQSKLSQP